MRATIIVMVLLLTTSVANAQTITGLIRGFGLTTCGQFAQHYQQSTDVETYFFSWAQGYMSAMNVATSTETHRFHNLSARSVDEEEASIRLYCNSHPLANYLDAVLALYDSLPIKDYP
jgi:hypothetical protein